MGKRTGNVTLGGIAFKRETIDNINRELYIKGITIKIGMERPTDVDRVMYMLLKEAGELYNPDK